MPIEPPPIPDDNRILYFDRDQAAFRFLSHFWPSPIAIDAETWPTVEHYYQSQKSFDADYRAAIRDANSAVKAKHLAVSPDRPRKSAKRSWFRRKGIVPREDWDEVKLDVMRRADFAKYAQNPELAALLLATGDAELIEDSPSDPYWGTGPDEHGLNWAGRILMEVRLALHQEGAVHWGIS